MVCAGPDPDPGMVYQVSGSADDVLGMGIGRSRRLVAAGMHRAFSKKQSRHGDVVQACVVFAQSCRPGLACMNIILDVRHSLSSGRHADARADNGRARRQATKVCA
jgi:hypothetical protein